MAYFQKHSKIPSNIEESSIQEASQLQQVNSNIFNKNGQKPTMSMNMNGKDGNNQNSNQSSYLKNFKKSYCKSNQQNVAQYNPQQNPHQQKQRQKHSQKNSNNNHHHHKQSDFSSITQLMKASYNKKQKNKQKGNFEKIYVDDDHSLNDSTFNNMIKDPEQSMEEMLNSSINQFQRFLEQQKNQQLIQQNNQLKKTLAKFKHILKEKLENGLKKQKEEVTKMLGQYVELITKLLHDKQQMSGHIQQLQDELKSTASHLRKLQRQFDSRLREKTEEKDQQISIIRKQLQEVESIIEQYEEQSAEEAKRTNQLESEVQRLRQVQILYKEIAGSNSQNRRCDGKQREDFQRRIDAQSQKIQTLLELLQKSQQQSNVLKEALSKQSFQLYNHSQSSSQDDIKKHFQQRIEQLQLQHEQEFNQYEKAVKQTILIKDNTIDKLNNVINQMKKNMTNSSVGIHNNNNPNQRNSFTNSDRTSKNKSQSVSRSSTQINDTNHSKLRNNVPPSPTQHIQIYQN